RANNSENAAVNTRDVRTGRFLTGNTGGGRPKGSRNKLGEAFVADVYDQWQKSGAKCLGKMSQDDPGGFCKLVAGVLPKQFDTTVTINADLFAEVQDFRAAYEYALTVVGGEVEGDDQR